MNYEIADDRRCDGNEILITDLKEGQFGIDRKECLWLRTDNSFLAFEDGGAVEYNKNSLCEKYVTLIHINLVITTFYA